MKSQAEKDFQATLRRPKTPRCQTCGNPDGVGPDGKQHRLLRVEDNKYECNYCATQPRDETLRGVGRCYGEFETVTRVQAHPHAVTDGFEDGFERQGSYNST